MQGTLTVTGLTSGASYEIYRWDSTDEAFVDYDDAHKRETFKAADDTYVFQDPTSFQSDSATYYTVVPVEAVV